MAGKYRDIIRGKGKPAKPVNLSPLKKELKEQAERLDTLEAALADRQPPADPDALFVTRAELREAVESGEVPVAWTVPADDAAAAAQPADDDTAADVDGGQLLIDAEPVKDDAK